MSIIDFHTHAFPDSLASRAIAALEAHSGDWRACLDGRVSSLLKSMDAAGIDKSIVCPIATRPAQFPGILEWCLQIRSERLIPLASVHPEAGDPAGEVEQAARAGLVGLKLHPMYQDFNVDDARMDVIYEAAQRLGLLVALHCGEDIAFPGSDQAHPRRVAAVSRRWPDLTLIATHLGGWKAWDAVREHLVGSRVWMETSFSLQFLPAEEAAELIHAHGVKKVLFGTDSPWSDQKQDVQALRQLPLTPQEQEDILGGNAQRLLERYSDYSL